MFECSGWDGEVDVSDACDERHFDGLKKIKSLGNYLGKFKYLKSNQKCLL